MRDACVEAASPRFEIHGALECENGCSRGVSCAEVHYGRGGEGTACTVSEDEGRGTIFGLSRRGVVVAGDGLLC